VEKTGTIVVAIASAGPAAVAAVVRIAASAAARAAVAAAIMLKVAPTTIPMLRPPMPESRAATAAVAIIAGIRTASKRV
jgi:hypothetical protein